MNGWNRSTAALPAESSRRALAGVQGMAGVRSWLRTKTRLKDPLRGVAPIGLAPFGVMLSSTR